jgi:hypothetical protein
MEHDQFGYRGALMNSHLFAAAYRIRQRIAE